MTTFNQSQQRREMTFVGFAKVQRPSRGLDFSLENTAAQGLPVLAQRGRLLILAEKPEDLAGHAPSLGVYDVRSGESGKETHLIGWATRADNGLSYEAYLSEFPQGSHLALRPRSSEDLFKE